MAITIFIFICLLGVLPFTDSLLCYQCSATGGKGECINGHDNFLKVSRHVLAAKNNTGAVIVDDSGSQANHYKNCDTFVNRTMCMIEEVRNGIAGTILSYIRDCSDGSTFSFDLKILKNLSPSNFTTCGYDNRGYQVCVTLCNSTDLCNGPQNITGASGCPTLNVLLYLLCVFTVCMKE
ncbi:uncharacterized protein LOC124284845 [Haliotis rubra]|uniref:uncharacterized protein LOC124284845 n=1 Tax=Haliotis rubra TaxID=36100 RepID=UPI001EE5C18B|nr:uncharacterized protein LOC124284845 [Haliotis rubra]